MKGNLKPGDKVYRLASKSLSCCAKASYEGSKTIQNPIFGTIFVHIGKPITLQIRYENYSFCITSCVIPVLATKQPITKERILQQLNKTSDTPFFFKELEVDLEANVFLPNVRILNELRRQALAKLEELIVSSYQKDISSILSPSFCYPKPTLVSNKLEKKISILLTILNTKLDYSLLNKDIERIYIPIIFFSMKKYENVLHTITNLFPTYIYLPNIIRENYRNFFLHTLETSVEKYKIKGFVISNIGSFECLKDYFNKGYEFIGNSTFNVFNSFTQKELLELGLTTVTLSPELSKSDILSFPSDLTKNTELIVYGRTLLMTTAYCLLGNANQSYPSCKQLCNSGNLYHLKDRLGFQFPIYADNVQTLNKIYNSKITCIDPTSVPITQIRADFLQESLEEINWVISELLEGKPIQGVNYTNGNWYRNV